MNSTFHTVAVAGVTALLVSSVFVVFDGNAGSTVPRSGPAAEPVQEGEPIVFDNDADAVDVIARAEPAVVSVIITKDLPVLEQYFESPFGDDPFFAPFDIRIPRVRENGTQRQEIGGGTAFFISRDGLLMTNKHVVADTEADYSVLLNDGTTKPATVVARDPASDIALLKIDGESFPFLTFSSQDPELGQSVIAIGNALGEFRNTVSVGVISGMSRSIIAGSPGGGFTERLTRLLQTDAAINQGNSGGPLLNMRGEVVGMNTAVATGAQNIGFAIPAAELTSAKTNYERHGEILRPYLGVRYVMITPDLQAAEHLPIDHGALVARGETSMDVAILPDSPAAKAGLREGDIIVEVDGQELSMELQLADVVRRKSPGDAIALLVLRDGEEITIEVTLEAQR